MIIVQAKVRCDHPDCLEAAKIDIRFKGNDNSNPNHKTWELHNKPEGWHIDMAAPYYKSGKQYCPAHQPVKKPKAKKPRGAEKPKKEVVVAQLTDVIEEIELDISDFLAEDN
jgi:hypothetical protein